MVITRRAGHLLLPGELGVRIEDDIWITTDGAGNANLGVASPVELAVAPV